MKHENLTYYRESILEILQDIDLDRYYLNKIDRKSISDALNLVEAYSIISRANGDRGAINESNSMYQRLESLIKEYSYRISHLNEGFENPFDEVDDHTKVNRYDDKVVVDPNKDLKINQIKMWNSNTPNKIMYRNGRIEAGQFFGKGDTIEECPVRIIYEKDMYSENIRDFAFTIDKARGIYAIPFGYASFYRNSISSNAEPNAEYEYVPERNGGYIRIYATRNIRKGHEIVLYADKTDFDNEIKPGQFDYSQREIEPYYSVKNVRIA